MRVNPNPLPNLLAVVNELQGRINDDLEQTASGMTVQNPSDAPAAAAMLVRNAGQNAEVDQFQRSLNSVQGEMQNADSALNSVVTSLQRAISLGVEGANGTLNDSNRQALAAEVRGIQAQLVSLANLSYQGSYVFAGTATQAAPYVVDATSPSGVRYVGNGGVNKVSLGSQLSLATNVAGSQIFSAPGADVFQALQDLITNLQSGTNIDVAVNEVSAAHAHVNSQRVFYGNGLNQLNAQQTYLRSESTQLAQQQNNIAGADLARVLSDLATAQTSYEATLEAIGQTQRTNLFDYLK